MAFGAWRSTWYWSLLPINASVGALVTLIPLYILSLGGTVLDVALAASSFNLALIPGAIIWGYLIDVYQKRKAFIFYPCVAEALILLAFYFSNGLAETVLLYALFGFVSVALAPAVSMLLMETAPKHLWANAFARSSTISTIGLILGVLPGVIWTQYFSLNSYFLLAALMALPSVILAHFLVKEPGIILERQAIAHTRIPFLHRLAHVPMFFLRLPRPTDVKSFYRTIQTGLTHELPLLYLATFLFFVSGSLFFTPYIPLLKDRGVLNRHVFLANLVIYLTNAATFTFAARMNGSYGENRAARFGYIVRVLGMFFGIVGALSLAGIALLLDTILVFALTSAGFTFSNTALNSIIFKALGASRRGELLGIYSALTALGLFLGSYFSGIVSFTLGFTATFSIALILLLFSMMVFGVFRKLSNHQHSAV